MAKEKKIRADKYEEKVKFEGSFEELVKLSVQTNKKKYPQKKK